MTMKENLFKEAKRFLFEFELPESDFFWKFVNEHDEDVMIHIPNREVYTFNLNNSKIGEDDFNEENGRYVNVSNWSYPPDSKCYFYNSFFPVVNSTWEELTIKIADHLYATIYKGMVYEWNDWK